MPNQEQNSQKRESSMHPETDHVKNMQNHASQEEHKASTMSFAEIKQTAAQQHTAQIPRRPQHAGPSPKAFVSSLSEQNNEAKKDNPFVSANDEMQNSTSSGDSHVPHRPQPSVSDNTARNTASFASTADNVKKVTTNASGTRKKDDAVSQRHRKKKSLKKGPERTLGDAPVLHSLIRAVIYIVCVLVVSALAAWGIISAANDVYAFVKDDTEISVEITPDMTVGDVAQLLKDNNLIQYPSLFRLYASLRDVEFEPEPGTYRVSAQLNYSEFLRTFNHLSTSTAREQVVITIPEGYDVDRIIDYLVNEKGVGEREKYIEAINEYPYDTEEFRFLRELPDNPDRKYRLEGYLFPDTYYVYQDSNEITVIYKMLQNTQSKINDDYYAAAQRMDMSLDQIMTIASMIQAESANVSEFENVSSVFYNRLSHPDAFPYLESDATVRYAVGNRTDPITAEQLQTVNPYNTYVTKGLPPGPICNPGLDAIRYALYPASTNYYFFVADNDGNTIFSETREQHEAAVAQVRAQAQAQT